MPVNVYNATGVSEPRRPGGLAGGRATDGERPGTGAGERADRIVGCDQPCHPA